MVVVPSTGFSFISNPDFIVITFIILKNKPETIFANILYVLNEDML